MAIENDFGFSAVDDPSEITGVVGTIQSNDDVLERLDSLSADIKLILEKTIDKTSFDSQLESVKVKELLGRLEKVEICIGPLLKKLLENPEKEYIHWPHRKGIIQAQIDKILGYTRV